MTVYLLQQGAAALLSGGWDFTEPCTFRLFTVDGYSGQTDATIRAFTEADLVEPTWIGYQAVAGTGWTLSTDTGGASRQTHDPISFTATQAPPAPVAVHGFWVERDSDGAAMWIDVADTGPFVVAAALTSPITVTPTFTLD